MMASLLLSELRNADIEQLQHMGKVQELVPGQVLVQPGQLTPQVYLVLSGTLDVILPYQNETNPKALGQMTCGSWAGSIPYLEADLPTVTLQAKTPCRIWSFDCHHLLEKLTQDAPFASLFYRVQAQLIMAQIQSLMVQFNLHAAILYQINIKETSSLFAALQDRHLDWLAIAGQRQQVPGGCLLQSAYRPIECFHVVLEGALSLGSLAEPIEDLTHLYLPIAQDAIQEVARIARGDVFGELRSLQSGAVTLPIHTVQVQALRDTELLSIPHWRMAAKVLHDGEFAMHFYRTLARLMAGKYRVMLTQLGFVTGQEMQEKASDRELAIVAKAEANFEWLVQRIQSKSVVGREIQWSLK